MNRIAGVDGCGWGWFAVLEDRGGHQDRFEYLLCPTFEQLVLRAQGVTVLAVDIPIGLPCTGYRQCDVEARSLLGRRAACVFWAPVWEAVKDGMSYERAASLNEAGQGCLIAPPAFAIVPKINEVNDLLMRRADLRGIVYEVHPELSLRAMNSGRTMTHGKRTSEGIEEREDVLETHDLKASYVSACDEFLPNNYLRPDDVIDAHAALWTARRIAADEADRLPEDQSKPLSANELPMLMWI